MIPGRAQMLQNRRESDREPSLFRIGDAEASSYENET